MVEQEPVVPFDQILRPEISLSRLWRRADRIPEADRTSVRLSKEADIFIRPHLRNTMIEELGVGGNIREAYRHFELLKSFGMCVVSYGFERSDRLSISDFGMMGSRDAVVAYGATKFVDHSYSLRDDETKDISQAKIEEFVVLPLKRYLRWCEETAQTYVLDDVFTKSQYSWQESSGVVFLHDVEPTLEIADRETLEVRSEHVKSF